MYAEELAEEVGVDGTSEPLDDAEDNRLLLPDDDGSDTLGGLPLATDDDLLVIVE